MAPFESSRGTGVRGQRVSIAVNDDVVKRLNVAPFGRYVVNGAEATLTQLG